VLRFAVSPGRFHVSHPRSARRCVGKRHGAHTVSVHPG
jgi:hypothetical protein